MNSLVPKDHGFILAVAKFKEAKLKWEHSRK